MSLAGSISCIRVVPQLLAGPVLPPVTAEFDAAIVARNVDQIAQLAEENNAAVAEAAGTAGELEQLAGGLRDEVSHFRL